MIRRRNPISEINETRSGSRQDITFFENIFMCPRGFKGLDISHDIPQDLKNMAEEKLKVQILEAMSALIIAAFGLVAALAWNEAIKTLVTEIFGTENNLAGLFAYAIIVTVLAVIMTILITRSVKKAKAAAEE